MNILDSVIGFFSPETACRRAVFRESLNDMQRQGYDSGDHRRQNTGRAELNE